MADGIYIPTLIADSDFKPAQVAPRQFFYNGKKSVDKSYYIGGLSTISPGAYTYTPYSNFPYFDHYSSGSTDENPDTSSESLLFYNEGSYYGQAPTQNLYSKYWSKYVGLLYNPTTRFIECSAVIPFGRYVNLNLNDIVVYKGKHFHLRAINDYDLSTGECNLQLLGPILDDALDNQ